MDSTRGVRLIKSLPVTFVWFWTRSSLLLFGFQTRARNRTDGETRGLARDGDEF